MEPGLSVNQCALPGAVPLIRRAVSRFLDPYHLPTDELADIGLAVTEACANVVCHAYPDGTAVPRTSSDETGMHRPQTAGTSVWTTPAVACSRREACVVYHLPPSG